MDRAESLCSAAQCRMSYVAAWIVAVCAASYFHTGSTVQPYGENGQIPTNSTQCPYIVEGAVRRVARMWECTAYIRGNTAMHYYLSNQVHCFAEAQQRRVER